MSRFSIIIPVRKINDFLKENIEHLKKLQYKDFEVLIITDEPEDYDFGEGWKDYFKIIVSKNPKPGVKRNLGAAQSSGDILAFLDDDAYPKDDWLTHANEIFADAQVYALGGPALTPLNVEFLEQVSGKIIESTLTSGGTDFRNLPMEARLIDDYPSVNLLVRKSAFEKVGGFITDFWPGEDTKLCLDLVLSYGRKFVYDPRPIVYHHRRNAFKPYLKQVSRYGQHRGQFAKIYPQTSRLPMYFVPSLFLMGLVLGPFSFTVLPFFMPIYNFVLGFYWFLLLAEGYKVYETTHDSKLAVYTSYGIFLTHVVYGFNFIVGFLKKPQFKSKAVDLTTGNYSEG